ncbi:UDP-4-amino-4,6-dideoxy-N-acetyl-beta-L-altrosamine N-acetyltransferase [Oceaniglobus indicus]|uniref:UDP-4-amino-4, 6-dideoxy-N-acetyl-beta-L-altrosamine N-acetyltransferase n=1 Tax=Oceaniglobus indicus TaxID=2047749 RepID=UPI000C1A194C|nr:UDP-4-amino-4,6-dideoxy-N-acetyl-beta-L-altrosamine N-acetyltransferase [Oceaniglobus indicus]
MTSLLARAGKLDLCPLADAPEDQAHALRDIRNEDGVRANMYSHAPIGADEHARWLDGVRGDASRRLFLVRRDTTLIGALAYSAIDPVHRRADWAFYLTAAVRGQGLGRALELRALDHAFGPLALNKLNCEVIAWNTPVIALHRTFGFAAEGIRRAHVLRDGVFHDVHLLGITAEEWHTTRPTLLKDTAP